MVGTRDATGLVKGYALTRLQEALQLEMIHCFAAEGREAVEVAYPVVMQSCPGDWHEMAGRYREWAVRQPWCRRPVREREDIPKAVRDAGAMAMVSYRMAATPPQQAVEIAQEALRKWGEVGAGPLLIHTRGWEKHGTWVAQEYFPPFPDEATFAATSRAAREQGSEHLVFLSGYVWTRTFGKKDDGSFEYDSRDYFERELKGHAVVEANGEVHVRRSSWLAGGENAELCRGDEWSRELISRVTEQLRGYGVRLVQIDQLVGGGGPVCYAANHGHPPGPGLWVHEAVVDQMERMLREGRAEGEFGLSLEEPNELYVPYLALYHGRDHEVQGWPLVGGAEPLPLFAYVYHEYARGYSGWLTHGIQGFREGNYGIALRYTTALAIANGKLLAFPVGFESEDKGVAGENRLLVAGARLATGPGKPWLAYGRMVPPPGLECATIEAVRTGQEGQKPAVYRWPGVVHQAYEDGDGRRAVVLVNHTREKQRAALGPSDGWRAEQLVRSGAEGVAIEALDPKAGPPAVELAPQEVALVVLGKAGP